MPRTVSIPTIPRPGMGAAHEAGVQHARQSDVVDVGAVTGQEPGVLHPVDPAARIAGRAGRAGCGVCHALPSTTAIDCPHVCSRSGPLLNTCLAESVGAGQGTAIDEFADLPYPPHPWC